MKKPTSWIGTIASIIGALIPVLIWLNSLSNEVAKQGVKIENVQTEQYNNQISTDKKLDRIIEQQDRIIQTQAEQRILIENKQNRH